MNDGFHLPNAKPYPRFWRWLLKWLQRKCQHRALKADILEGCSPDYSVRWCETCGAVWLAIDGSPCGLPRMPEPTWEPSAAYEPVTLSTEFGKAVHRLHSLDNTHC